MKLFRVPTETEGGDATLKPSSALAAPDSLVQDAVIRNLEVIGEASHRIATRFPEFAAQHPELPLSSAYQMRNAVAHGYFEIDLAIVWATVVIDLPGLAHELRGLVAEGSETT